MGYPISRLEHRRKRKQEQTICDLQRYFSQLFRKLTPSTEHTIERRQMLSSIFTRTLVSTKTGDHRDLALLDADKILSLKMGSLSEKSNNMKCMRMVVGLMHQNDSAGQDNFSHIYHLVRMARLHFLWQQRQNNMLTAQREEVRDETEGDALRETFNIREREGEEDLTNVADINWIG